MRTKFRFRNNTRKPVPARCDWTVFLPLANDSYNAPKSFAMMLSQLAHSKFMEGWYGYDKYVAIQNEAYRQFPPQE